METTANQYSIWDHGWKTPRLRLYSLFFCLPHFDRNAHKQNPGPRREFRNSQIYNPPPIMVQGKIAGSKRRRDLSQLTQLERGTVRSQISSPGSQTPAPSTGTPPHTMCGSWRRQFPALPFQQDMIPDDQIPAACALARLLFFSPLATGLEDMRPPCPVIFFFPQSVCPGALIL